MNIAHAPELTRLWTARTWPFISSTLALMTSIAFEAFAITTVLPVAMADLGGVEWYSLAFSATITAGLVGMVMVAENAREHHSTPPRSAKIGRAHVGTPVTWPARMP